MNKLIMYKTALISIYICMFSLCVFGQEEHCYTDIQGVINPGDQLVVSDDKIWTPLYDDVEEDYSVRNRLSLQIDNNPLPANLETATYTINFTALTWDSTASSGTAMHTGSISESLILDYDSDLLNTSDFIDFYDFADAYKVEVTVDQVSVSPASVTIPDLILKAEIYIDRLYEFETTDMSGMDLVPSITSISDSDLPSTGKVDITWSNFSGATEYDFEWSFYDEQSEHVFNPELFSVKEALRNNATRVTTRNTEYSIQTMYPEGEIYFRVRAARYKDGVREFTKWSSSNQTGLNLADSYSVEWHEIDLNWQSQISFAEEGKNVPSINYFDGSLRQRQSVTFSNAIDHPILQETIYDYLGRPTISVMASPDLEKNKIEFDPLFSVDASSLFVYTKSNITTTNGCLDAPPAMSQDYGAGKYYSPNNPDITGKNKFIPDASGYTFSTSEYTPDLTGRMRRQSGVGETFMLNSGHETQYYFSKAAQEELDKIFDDQVGEQAHYQKNMVRDPNGQFSISYIDANGRTIATALAGDEPPNTASLNSNVTPTDIQYDLLNNIVNNYTLTSSYPLTVSSENEMIFTYSVDPKTPIFDCLPADICYDCVYDLTITIDDNCGNIFNGGVPIVIENTNFPASSINTLCSDPDSGISENLTQTIPVGEYKITKVLSVNESAANLYVEDFLEQTTCLPDKNVIYQNLFDETDFTDCNEEGTIESINECEMIRQTLLIDVHPGGLMAPYTLDETTNELVIPEGLLKDDAFRAYFPNELVFFDGETELQVNMLTAEEFIQFFQPEWAEYLIEGHDEIGCYDSCFDFNEDTGVADFILNVQNTETYQDAITAGYINPMTCQPVLINADPGMSGGQGCSDGGRLFSKVCYIPTVFNELFNQPPYLLEHWQVNGVNVITNFSFNTFDELANEMDSADIGNWQVEEHNINGFTTILIINEDDTGNDYGELRISNTSGSIGIFGTNTVWYPCPNNNYDIIDDFLANVNPYTCVPNSVINIISQAVYCDGDPNCNTTFGKGCDTDNDLAWNLYKHIYLTQQGSLLSSEYCNFQSFMTDRVNDNYERFEEPIVYQGDSMFELFPPDEVDEDYLNDQKDLAEAELLVECESNCASLAIEWMSQLIPCGVDDTHPEYMQIKDRLIAVCQQGCADQTTYNPFGASTCLTPVSPPHNDLSFENVLSSLTEITDCDTECNPKMITFPPPLGVDTYLGNRLISTIGQGDMDDQGNNCMCDNVVEYETCYNSYITNNGGVDEFGSLSAYLAQFTAIDISQTDLDDIKTFCLNTCNALPNPVAIPAYLECDVCKEFDTVDADASAFVNIYTNTYACAGETDTDAYFDLRAVHLNNLYGFNLVAEDYNTYLDNPNGYTSDCYLLCPRSTFGYLPSDNSPAACEAELIESINLKTEIVYENKLDDLREEFILSYMGQCVEVLNESFTADGKFSEYHFTLYYYDQSGNLVQTVPPQGTTDGSNELKPPANYDFKTKYNYNSFDQVVEQVSPDIDVTTKFWYDNVGRVVASQDGRQQPQNLYSYTIYDELGRIIEVGEAIITGSFLQPNESNTRDNSFSDWITTAPYKSYVTRTYYDSYEYDLSTFIGETFRAENVRNRVAQVTIEYTDDGVHDTYDAASHYSYDITGNVQTLIQEINALDALGHRFKRIDYEYDYISGNVNAVLYQTGEEDQFTHRYLYDENNRLTDVKTSAVETGISENNHSGVATQSWNLWNNEASYEYYDHGPVVRTILGEQKVQGCDYAYTLQGWIKGMNSGILDPNKDMGADGSSITAPALDAHSCSLGYFDGDYDPIIGAAESFEVDYTGSYFNLASASLYNGNIRNMTVDVMELNQPIGYTYEYDQLHRVKSMEAHENVNSATFTWGMMEDMSTSYETTYAYDANGNINSLTRNGLGVEEDNLSYTYEANSNRLITVIDGSVLSPNTAGYIAGTNNYEYDGVGNIIEIDVSGMGVIDPYVNTITWTPYGKVDQVEQDYTSLSSLRTIEFDYGPDQNRLSKSTTFDGSTDTDYYVRDAQGNVMAVYSVDNNSVITWGEQHVYGSSRLGLVKIDEELSQTSTAPLFPTLGKVYEGQKSYELSNHLGNTQAIISDRKKPIETSGILSHYEPIVLRANDYYPFGQDMNSGRSYTANNNFSYRYGFNGKEKDEDGEFGNTTHYDYGFRIYNPSIAKFLSVDPLTKDYPWYTPYQFAGNTPIQAIDLDGLEPTSPIEDWSIGTKYVHGQMLYGDNYWVFSSVSNTGKDIHQYYDPDDKVEPWKQFEPLVAEPIAQDVSHGAAVIMGGVVATVVVAPIVIENAGSFIIKEGAEFLFEEMTGVPIVNGPEDFVEYGVKRVGKETTEEVVEEVIPVWNGPVDYSDIIDHKSVGPGKKFTAAQKKKILDKNREANDGLLRSDLDGSLLDKAVQSRKDVKANMKQAEVDHKRARNPSDGGPQGSNSASNAQVLSKRQNIDKSNN